MDLVGLRCFVTVGEELHFGRAAERLGYTTSNVSHRVRQLERELKVTLFARTSRSVSLTRAGTELLDAAIAVLSATSELGRLANEMETGHELRLTLAYCAFTTQMARLLVEQLRGAWPDAEIEPIMHNHTLEVLQSVADGSAEVGVTKWRRAGLEQLRLRPPQDLVLLVPEGHRFQGKESVSYWDLDGERLLLLDPSQNKELHDLTLQFCAERAIHPLFRRRKIASLEQGYEFVATNQGIAFTYATEQAPPGMAFVPLVGPRPPINELYLVWDGSRDAPLVAEMISAARNYALPN